MLTAVISFSSRALLTRLRCPSWSAPIVGTNPIVLPRKKWVFEVSCIILGMRMISILIRKFPMIIFSTILSYIKSRDFVKQQMHNVGFSGLDMLKFNTVEEVGTVKSVDGMFATVMLPKKARAKDVLLEPANRLNSQWR